MQAKLMRVVGALLSALTAMIGASITLDMDWVGFLDMFMGKGAPVIVIGLLGVAWAAARDGTPIKRPKMLKKVMGGKE